MKAGSSVGIYVHLAYAFVHICHQITCSVRTCLKKNWPKFCSKKLGADVLKLSWNLLRRGALLVGHVCVVRNHQWFCTKWKLSRDVIHIAHMFLHVWRQFVCSVGAYQQNFCIGAQSEVH